jgi:FkbM family methyltransferase
VAVRKIQFGGELFEVEVSSPAEQQFWDAYTSHQWEYQSLCFMMDNRRRSVFLDIGSWIGPVSLLMAKLYEKVVAVDMDPVANEKLRKNLALNRLSNVAIHPIALSNRSELVSVNSSYFGSSMTNLYTPPGDAGSAVNTIRFDEFVRSLAERDQIGFIKIDCEGAEYKFLFQVYAFVRKQRIMAHISYHPFVLKKPRYYFVKLIHWFTQLQFDRYYLSRKGHWIFRRRFVPQFRLTDNFPMADVIAR